MLQNSPFFLFEFVSCRNYCYIFFNVVLQVSNTSLKTRRVVVELCNIIATRGARLAAAGILGVLKKMGRDAATVGGPERTVVAIDGGLYQHYTEYRKCLENTLLELLGDDSPVNISFKLSEDGSGIGAALLAATHSQHKC